MRSRGRPDPPAFRAASVSLPPPAVGFRRLMRNNGSARVCGMATQIHFEVVIAGGGVAALEAALALRDSPPSASR